MRLSLGFPRRDAERALLEKGASSLSELVGGLDPAALLALQQRCSQQHVSEHLIEDLLDLVQATRSGGRGLSPRATQGLKTAAQAWAMLEGRDHVRIHDVQAVLPAVAEHRLDVGAPSESSGGTPFSKAVLEQVNALR